MRTVQFSLLLASTAAFAPAPVVVTRGPQHVMSSAVAEVETAAPPMAPLTLWGNPIPDIRQLQEQMRKQDLPEFAPEVSAQNLGLEGNVEAQLQYFQDHGMELKEQMERHGAVVFRNFELMKTQEGFQQFYQAVGMKPCLDPLHSVSARPTVDGSKNSPVYEAVNKESRKNFFIGTCCYMTNKQTRRCCVTLHRKRWMASSSACSDLAFANWLFVTYDCGGRNAQ